MSGKSSSGGEVGGHGDYVAFSAQGAPENPEAILKRPLKNEWSFWFYKVDLSKAWEDNLLEIASVKTVETFWMVYEHIKAPSELPPGCDFAVFRKGIKPMWEDELNKNGGRWIVKLKPKKETDIDDKWLQLLVHLLGEDFQEVGDVINGVVVQVRYKGCRISVWTTNENLQQINILVGKKLKSILDIQEEGTMTYEAFSNKNYKNNLEL